MFLNKKAQSTAEYAIVFALVVAVVAGVLQAALKGGMRQKNRQALEYLLDAGINGTSGLPTTFNESASLFSEEYRQTTVDAGSYIDEKVMLKGGAEVKQQRQQTTTNVFTVETINAVQ